MVDESKYFRRELVDGVTVVTLDGRQVLDREKLAELREEMTQLVDQERPQKLLVDFDGLQYCTSEFIGVLIRAHRQLSKESGRVDLCNLQSTIREVFKTLNLDGTMFHIHPSRKEALKAFQHS